MPVATLLPFTATPSRKSASPTSFRLTEKFILLLVFSAFITLCFGAIFFLPDSSSFSAEFSSIRLQWKVTLEQVRTVTPALEWEAMRRYSLKSEKTTKRHCSKLRTLFRNEQKRYSKILKSKRKKLPKKVSKKERKTTVYQF
ncbi:hypothetical protein SKAU_G00257620 [Synaphobranchus kaupii]|uniref:Uncharacterized protein n=1 Tax=Synaphobranchus kaupii TaxID=118154 RepID=A0A9Q1ISJ3_SYNKA|nr:hypothetical protein SKAU_G00257620 [Synaphobranchus kaupii]